MPNGDLLLDALGNRILTASGNVRLSDGAGDDCCCQGDPCRRPFGKSDCEVDTGFYYFPTTFKLTFSGLIDCPCPTARIAPGLTHSYIEYLKRSTFQWPVSLVLHRTDGYGITRYDNSPAGFYRNQIFVANGDPIPDFDPANCPGPGGPGSEVDYPYFRAGLSLTIPWCEKPNLPDITAEFSMFAWDQYDYSYVGTGAYGFWGRATIPWGTQNFVINNDLPNMPWVGGLVCGHGTDNNYSFRRIPMTSGGIVTVESCGT